MFPLILAVPNRDYSTAYCNLIIQGHGLGCKASLLNLLRRRNVGEAELRPRWLPHVQTKSRRCEHINARTRTQSGPQALKPKFFSEGGVSAVPVPASGRFKKCGLLLCSLSLSLSLFALSLSLSLYLSRSLSLYLCLSHSLSLSLCLCLCLRLCLYLCLSIYLFPSVHIVYTLCICTCT